MSTLNKETAQKIIDLHGVSWDINQAGRTVKCVDTNKREFNIVEMNSGHIFTEASYSPIIVNLTK